MTRAKRSTSTASANGSRKKTRLRQQASITSWLSNLHIKNEDNQDASTTTVEDLSVAVHNDSPALDIKEEDTDKMEGVIEEQQASSGEDSSDSNNDYTVKTDAQIARLLQEDPSEAEPMPDPEDPNFYCRVCKITDTALWRYRKHCRRVHHMKLDTLMKKYKPIPGVKPVLKDPNNYCRACRASFPSPKAYSAHLNMKHWAEFPAKALRTRKNMGELSIKTEKEEEKT
ncbi:hypothetical protein G6F42_024199 [Rhizopus arrhizus]|nr:hypothetical protein G6F42_024199 [Rhizopus arrhizus]